MLAPADEDVGLLDAGEGRRLERFGPRIVDRPAPTATFWLRDRAAWAAADLRFDDGRWTGPADPSQPWTVEVDGLRLELRPTASGGLGLYPEHAANLPFLEGAIRARPGPPAPTVLNLFAHTGLATLAAARAGAAVTHLDSARGVVAWARRNAALSGLADRPIRWIVDDALAFVRREGRRGRRYDGFIVDPPSYGRAGRRRWSLEEGLGELLEACAAIAAPEAFVLVTAHTTGLDPNRLADAVREAFQATPANAINLLVEPMELTADSGAVLQLGWAVRLG